MTPEVGAVLEGRVTGITKFGAFVSLPDGKSGLVHISEVANTYVTDVHEHLQLGQAVSVRVLSVSEEGKINLSIKRAAEPVRSERPSQPPRPKPRPVSAESEAAPPSADQAFEDRLKKFMQESDSRIADNRFYADRPRRNNRRK